MTLVLEPRSNISVSILNGAVADVMCSKTWDCLPLIYNVRLVDS